MLSEKSTINVSSMLSGKSIWTLLVLKSTKGNQDPIGNVECI